MFPFSEWAPLVQLIKPRETKLLQLQSMERNTSICKRCFKSHSQGVFKPGKTCRAPLAPRLRLYAGCAVLLRVALVVTVVVPDGIFSFEYINASEDGFPSVDQHKMRSSACPPPY